MRIVIVEDEIKIREGMGKMIESQTDHMVIGEAADGREGLQMILKSKPDLVITDIRMPHMDGLEMLKELNDQNVKVHSVILSGYSEFEYARKAILYGVDEYLLKPLAAEDVKKMLDRIEDKIQKEKTHIYGYPESRLRDILFGLVEPSEDAIEELRRVCGFEQGMEYELAAGYVGMAQPSYKKAAKDEMESLQKACPGLKVYALYQENTQILFCLAAAKDLSEQEKERYFRAFYNQLIRKYYTKDEKPIWVNTKCTEQTMQRARKQLVNNLTYALVLKNEGWISEEMIRNYQPELYEYPFDVANQLKSAICKDEKEEIKKAGEAFIAYMCEHHFAPADVRIAFIRSYYLVEETLRDIDDTLREHLKNSGIRRRLETVFTFNELQCAWEDVIKLIIETRVKREDISNYIIQKAINYIRDHYKESITQEELSRKLEITPEYLSTLFSREVGINFSLFLKQFRISHAKRLLKGTNMKIYEVAESVGYNDAKYFARVFKEIQGVTPGEYRQMD